MSACPAHRTAREADAVSTQASAASRAHELLVSLPRRTSSPRRQRRFPYGERSRVELERSASTSPRRCSLAEHAPRSACNSMTAAALPVLSAEARDTLGVEVIGWSPPSRAGRLLATPQRPLRPARHAGTVASGAYAKAVAVVYPTSTSSRWPAPISRRSSRTRRAATLYARLGRGVVRATAPPSRGRRGFPCAWPPTIPRTPDDSECARRGVTIWFLRRRAGAAGRHALLPRGSRRAAPARARTLPLYRVVESFRASAPAFCRCRHRLERAISSRPPSRRRAHQTTTRPVPTTARPTACGRDVRTGLVRTATGSALIGVGVTRSSALPRPDRRSAMARRQRARMGHRRVRDASGVDR